MKLRTLLGKLIETFDILKDKDAMDAIQESEEELKAGRERGYDEFTGETKKFFPLWTVLKTFFA